MNEDNQENVTVMFMTASCMQLAAHTHSQIKYALTILPTSA